MKGELWLHLSTPEGSDFRFRIPCRVPAPAQTPDPIPLPGSAPATLSPGSLRLLVAEDNTVNQLLIRRLLERAGHSPILAANGRIAVDLFSQKGFDAVLMDVQMPEMDGLEATAAIRCRENANALPRIPIIGLTAHSLKGDRERFLQAGMDECLTKPVQFEELLAALDRYCPSLQAKE
jgi:CheY-like chemotaxis protein